MKMKTIYIITVMMMKRRSMNLQQNLTSSAAVPLQPIILNAEIMV